MKNNRFHGRTLTINTAHSIDDDENLREFIFRTYFRSDADQEQLLDELLRKRFVMSIYFIVQFHHLDMN